jgi:site-specific DNA recombinase
VVNPEDALRVRAIFELYLHCQALPPVVLELERQAWHNKRELTRKGEERGGAPFTKTNLPQLLRVAQDPNSGATAIPFVARRRP